MSNRWQIIGHLGRDPELRTTTGGDAVCGFSVADTEKWKDRNGAQQERTTWADVSVFGRMAENCAKYLSKGSKVRVYGSVHLDEYEHKGEKKAKLKLTAREVEFLDPPKPGGSSTAAPAGQDIPF